jgi:exodeoxyribonuclease VII large subunit
MRKVESAGRSLRVSFPYDPRLVSAIKALPRRRWDGDAKQWIVPADDVKDLVDLLANERFTFDEATREAYAAAGGTRLSDAPIAKKERGLFDLGPVESAPAAEPDAWTVSRLNLAAKAAIEAAFPSSIWLVGEISGFNKSAHKKHVGFTLVETDDAGGQVAQVNAILFAGAREAIEAKLAAAGDPFRLEDEVEVRVRCRVGLYEAWGQYRVEIEDLDVAYTLGEAARRREEIVRKLTEEGLAGLNPSLPMPDLPLRVGVITSLGSDAYNDVLKTLREAGFAFEVTVHGARVQGRATEPSVLNALDHFRERRDAFDVVLICRGGGSRTDLAWFDSEPLGRAVATFPLPVIVGIGHEQDHSVLDFVARRAKTPTAAAQMVVARVQEALDRVNDAVATITDLAADAIAVEKRAAAERGLRLARAARHLLDREHAALDRAGRDVPRGAVRLLDRAAAALEQGVRQLVQGTRRDLATARRRIDERAGSIVPRAARATALAGERLEARARRLHLVDPRRVVERGYAVLRRSEGGVVTDAAAAPKGSVLTAELRQGILRLLSEGSESGSDA